MSSLIILAIVFSLLMIFFIVREKKKEKRLLNRNSPNEHSFFEKKISNNVKKSPSYKEEAVAWCADFLNVGQETLKRILTDNAAYYDLFWVAKRSGGYRMISAPKKELKSIHHTIYHKILSEQQLHPAATGFRPNMSIVANARLHLGHRQLLKTDIHDFFGSIRKRYVTRAFKGMGYEPDVAKVLAALCCKSGGLPQGAPTSPALSNLVAAEMDRKLTALSESEGLTYTRYADDMVFSGDVLPFDKLLPRIKEIVADEKLTLNNKKTSFLDESSRKIITGVSISSGVKLTIPKRLKREIRKNVYFVLTKGLAEHQKYIGSSDPVYLKRLIGRLCFWHAVEPDNSYVMSALAKLKALNSTLNN